MNVQSIQENSSLEQINKHLKSFKD